MNSLKRYARTAAAALMFAAPVDAQQITAAAKHADRYIEDRREGLPKPQHFTFNGENFSFQNGGILYLWKFADRVVVYNNSAEAEIIDDYNSNGIIGDVPEDRYVEILSNGKRRITTRNSFTDENDTVYKYQGPHYYASVGEQKIVAAGRKKLAEVVTPRYQKMKAQAFKTNVSAP